MIGWAERLSADQRNGARLPNPVTKKAETSVIGRAEVILTNQNSINLFYDYEYVQAVYWYLHTSWTVCIIHPYNRDKENSILIIWGIFSFFLSASTKRFLLFADSIFSGFFFFFLSVFSGAAHLDKLGMLHAAEKK